MAFEVRCLCDSFIKKFCKNRAYKSFAKSIQKLPKKDKKLTKMKRN